MGRKSRRKGYEGERAAVLAARAAGLDARRVPLSGGAEGYPGDLILDGRRYEVKRRARGFALLYRWLGDNAGLILRADRKEPLVVVPLEAYLGLLSRAREATRARLEREAWTPR